VRLAAGLTRAELAARCGWDPGAIENYEMDGTNPKWPAIVRLIRVLGETFRTKRPHIVTLLGEHVDVAASEMRRAAAGIRGQSSVGTAVNRTSEGRTRTSVFPAWGGPALALLAARHCGPEGYVAIMFGGMAVSWRKSLSFSGLRRRTGSNLQLLDSDLLLDLVG
jgi:transcriptional regulator with XRE-family HTH domain